MLAKAHDVVVGVLERRPVIKHQEQASERQHQKQKKAQSTHAPGVTELHAGLSDPHRVQMQKDVREHDQHTVSVRVRPLVSKHRRPDLGFGQPVPEARRRAFFRFDGLDFCRHWLSVSSFRLPASSYQTLRNASGSIHWPSSYWNFRLLSTRIW